MLLEEMVRAHSKYWHWMKARSLGGYAATYIIKTVACSTSSNRSYGVPPLSERWHVSCGTSGCSENFKVDLWSAISCTSG